MKLIRLMILGLAIFTVPEVKAGTVYDAVADFSIAANPNGAWSYLYKTPSSGPSLMTHKASISGLPGVVYWSNGQQPPGPAHTLLLIDKEFGRTIFKNQGFRGH